MSLLVVAETTGFWILFLTSEVFKSFILVVERLQELN